MGTGLVCEWFLLCTNEAVTKIHHPVLGQVPICQRCLDKLDKIG